MKPTAQLSKPASQFRHAARRAKVLRRLTTAVAVACGFALAGAQAQTLSTLAANNGSGGIFLDLAPVAGSLNLTGFSTYFSASAGSAVSVEVWTRSGSYAGFTTTNTGWTLWDTVAGTSAGTAVESSLLNLTTPLQLAAGQTTAVYFHSITVGGGIYYQGTGGVATTTFSNADISLFSDVARIGSVAFAGTQFTPRAFAGTIAYLPATSFFWTGDQSAVWTTNNAGNTNWATTVGGGTDTTVIPGAANDVVFSATGATNQTTTLGTDFTIKSLTIADTAAVTIGGANTLTISGAAGTGIDVQSGAGLFTLSANLTLAGPSDTITVNNAAGAVISGVIDGSNGLKKEGTGTLTLTGVNAYTGGTTLNGGALALAGGGSLLSAGTVTVNAGTFEFRDSTSAQSMTINNSDTLKFLNTSTADAAQIDNNGAGSHTIFSATNAGDAVTAGTATIINSGLGSYVQFDALYDPSFTSSTAGSAIIRNTADFSRALFYQNATAGNATITNEVQGSFSEFFNKATVGTASIDNQALKTYTKFQDQVKAGTATLLNSGEQSSFLFNGSSDAENATITNSGKNSFTNFLDNSTANAATITNSGENAATFFFSNASGGTARLINNSTTGAFDFSQLATTGTTVGSIEGNGAVFLGSKALMTGGNNLSTTFSGVISDGGAGGGTGGSLTKDGTGTLTLTGFNTYTGGTTLNSGTLLAGNNNALGGAAGGALTINGGTLGSSGGNVTLANAVVVNGDFSVAPKASGQFRLRLDGDVDLGGAVRTITNVVDGTELAFRGSISGSGGVTFLAGAGNIANYVFYTGGGVNTYTGLTTVGANVGLVLDRGVNDSAISGDFLIEAGGTTVLLRNEQINDDATVTINSTGNANFAGSSGLDLLVSNERIGRLEGTGSIGLGAGTLRVRSGDFAGTIQDGSYASGGRLIKRSNDVLTLTGANTYNGETIINQGTLLANNVAGSATGSGPVTINNGGILGGSGTVSGPISLEDFAKISPGAAGAASIGTLRGSDVIWKDFGQMEFDLGATGDQLALTGTLTNGGTFGPFIVLANDEGIAQPLYSLVTFAGTTFTQADLANFLLVLPAGFTGSLSLDADSLDLALAISLSGPVIQNSVPVGTPTFADFIVNGPVTTGGPTENNTIRSLIFGPGGSLRVNNTLFVTGGAVNLPGGSSILLNGFLSASQLNMFINSLLSGNGGILGNLVNNGLVSPGNSPGVIRASGNYTQSRTGTLRIEVGGTSEADFDRLIVGGHANLDGTLDLVRLNNFDLKRGDKITFLVANGGVDGEFFTVNNPFESDTILEPTVVYGDTTVSLEMVRGSFEKYAAHWGLTPNQRAVAGALDRVSADEPNDEALVYLDERKLDKLPGDFDRIAPEELTSIFTISTSLANVQSLNLQRRTDDIRHGASGFSASGLAMQGSGPGYSGSLFGAAGPSGKESKEMKEPAPLEEKKWGAFVTGVGEWVDVGGDGNARGYDITTGGFTLGLDYKVCPNFVVGIAAGYAGTGADLTDGGDVWVNGGKLGIYATTFVGGWYADAAVTGGYNSYDTKRSALQGTARGDTEGGELNVLAGTGYDWKVGALTIGPTATFQYTLVGIDGFTETGSLAPLTINSRNAESVRTSLGFKASYDWKVGGVLVRPEIRASWQHEFGDSSYALDASFANGAGGNFLVNGPEIGRDSVLLGAGVAIQCSERFSTYFYYDGELGRANYDRHGVSGGVRVAF